jgi:hypothetical protein
MRVRVSVTDALECPSARCTATTSPSAAISPLAEVTQMMQVHPVAAGASAQRPPHWADRARRHWARPVAEQPAVRVIARPVRGYVSRQDLGQPGR